MTIPEVCIRMKEGLNLSDLERTATIISWDGQHFTYYDDDFISCQLTIDLLPPNHLLERILDSVGKCAKETSRVETPFEKITPLETAWWQENSKDIIKLPIGRAGARKIQFLELGQGMSQHVLIVGKTGSGKSTLLHILLTSLVLNYSPQEVEVYLVDFKKGVEFKTYAIHELPHARVIAIESEREFGLSVLQGLNTEMNRRGELFRNIAVDHISEYRGKSNKHMPRILLLVDEFQEFFVEDDGIASQSAQILDRLVRQGRAFGIHVLLGSQTIAGTYNLARSTIDQMAVRIALQCSESDSRLILAEDNPAARLLSRPGQAIYNSSNGLIEGNNLFQVAWLLDEKRDAYLRNIKKMAEEKGYLQEHQQIVFEGNAPANVINNITLINLISTPLWPQGHNRVAAYLGEPVAIKEATTAYFSNQNGDNLLVVGRNDEVAAGVMLISLISIAAQYKPENIQFYILNFNRVDTYMDVFNSLDSFLPHRCKIGHHRDLAEVISKVGAEVRQRRSDNVDFSRIDSFIYIFILGLQHARDLRQEDDYSYLSKNKEEPDTANISTQFDIILREGPDVGVHILTWCDTYTNFTRILDRRLLREFEKRIIFQMSSEDSTNLIDTPMANKLGQYRAFFFNEGEGQLEKFRPYGLPTQEWLAWVGERLRGKENNIKTTK